jgi:REP element-mobilizing transposase RayT
MAGIARAVAAGLPHHLTPRENRRRDTFFGDDDYRAYIRLMGEWRTKCGAEVWWCRNQEKALCGGGGSRTASAREAREASGFSRLCREA